MNVILSKDASKQYGRLSKSDQTKIHKKLLALEQSPYEGKKLNGELGGIRSLRAWPYRILYEITCTYTRCPESGNQENGVTHGETVTVQSSSLVSTILVFTSSVIS